MRAIKVLVVALTATASLVVGVAATAAPASHNGASSATRWCCWA